MKEGPILFSAPMVRAVLAGAKTQTRRVVKPQPDSRPGLDCTRLIFKNRKGEPLLDEALEAVEPVLYRSLCPYGQPGDRLWVRENGWERPERTPKMMREGADTWEPYYFDADGYDHPTEAAELKAWGFKRRPSIHMPRWASRILLEVTEVRVERLQDISEADAEAEGARRFLDVPMGTPSATPCRWSMETPASTDECLSTARWAFASYFCKVNSKGRGGVIDSTSWDANPWVWAVSFRRIS